MSTSESLRTNPFFTIFEKQRNNRANVNSRSIQNRIKILTSLEQIILRYRYEFQEALYKDFKKPPTETDLTELFPVLGEIRHARSNLRNWMRPQIVDNPITFTGTKSTLIRNGKGICLIISPWNYPVNLTFGPMVSAIAAGNTAIIKPSELTPNAATLMKKIVEELFLEEEIAVINGNKETAEKLLELPFDHILLPEALLLDKV